MSCEILTDIRRKNTRHEHDLNPLKHVDRESVRKDNRRVEAKRKIMGEK
jgi:hypothetical protein